MKFNQNTKKLAACISEIVRKRYFKSVLLIFVFSMTLSVTAFSQENRSGDWLNFLRQTETKLKANNLSDNERRELQNQLNRLREEIQIWLSNNPKIRLENQTELNQINLTNNLLSGAELAAEINRWQMIVESIIRQNPNSPFTIGRVEVTVSDELPTEVAAGTVTAISQTELQQYNRKTVADALNLVPGVILTRIGPRNEGAVYVRGFDVDQVPVLIDGIPVYVPYDGYLDLNRFTTFDLSEVRVSKGFASPLYGANTIGGAINLVSRRPQRKLEGSVGAGAASGDTYDTFLNLGTKFDKFYVQGGGSFLQSQRFPLSGNFTPTKFQTASDFRLNSDHRDQKVNFKFGYTPTENSEYSLTYVNQRSVKGNPPYAGTDSRVARPRYWRWNYWDKESLYFISNTNLGSSSYVRFRGFYDKFDNLLTSYDDARYSTVTRPYAFRSTYDDDTFGGSVEFGTTKFERQQLKAAFHYKHDTHQENNVGEPVRTFKDQTTSFGFEDTIRLPKNLSLIAGFSVDTLEVKRAQDFQNGRISEYSLSGAGTTAFNPQIGMFYQINDTSRFRFTFSRKSRLPTIKDRYSYRMGQAIPNPGLRAERSNNFEAGYSQSFNIFGINNFAEGAVFYSDIRDLVQRFVISPTLFQLRNIAKAEHAGVELNLRSYFSNRIDTNLSYTYLNRKNETAPFTILTETPRHKLFGSLGYTPINKLRFQGVIQFEDGRYNLNEPGAIVRLSQFTTVDISTTYRFPHEIEIQGGVRNLFDRNYQLFEGYPEAGRNFFVNLRYFF